ncbi:MAG: hypothetical protein R3F14_17050 [Polyangiaceae bacterium]
MSSTQLRLRTAAFVVFEGAGATSWVERLAAAEVPTALMWGVALIGMVAVLLVVPHVSVVVGGVLAATEMAFLSAAVLLSVVWWRGQRTPTIEEDGLRLVGARDSGRSSSRR